jgi:hypothetical protein
MIDETFLTSLLAQGAEPFGGRPPLRVHWTPRRKATLVFAIKVGKIDRRLAQTRFGLSEEELEGWIAAIETNGIPGLRVTRYQIYRDNPLPRESRCQLSQSVMSLSTLSGPARPIMREIAGR